MGADRSSAGQESATHIAEPESGRVKPEATVFVVDDDLAARKSLRRLLIAAGVPVETYGGAEAFLHSYEPARPGCLVLDICMPGMNGLDLQEKLAQRKVRLPVIIFSAHADAENVVRAMRHGAIDFIRKPCKGKELLDRIRQALRLDARLRQGETERVAVAARLALLTPREREVMGLLITGRSSKAIAEELGLTRKTLDVHRRHIMTKMRTDSLVALARLLQSYEVRYALLVPPRPETEGGGRDRRLHR